MPPGRQRVAHVPEHDLGAAAYAIEAARAAHPRGTGGAHRERDWQRDQLDRRIRSLVLEDETRRNDLCWRVFGD